MSNSTTPAIRLTDVHKTFPGPHGSPVHAVAGLDLTVAPGEVVAFLGPNGAGKTTTIDMVLGLSTPTSGRVEVFGMTPRQAISRGLTAAVMQTGGLLPDLSVRETVELTGSLFTHAAGVDAALERADLTALASRQVRKCSGGEQQRLRFAMALVSDPALLILDEPTTGMDVESRRHFWQAIHADAERGRTIVFATHYLEEADEFADRVILVREGRIVADGTSAQIRATVSGRTVRATLARGVGDHDVRAALAGLAMTELTVLGTALTVVADDTDPIALALLKAGLASDLDITSRGLEEAFVALTATTEQEAA